MYKIKCTKYLNKSFTKELQMTDEHKRKYILGHQENAYKCNLSKKAEILKAVNSACNYVGKLEILYIFSGGIKPGT